MVFPLPLRPARASFQEVSRVMVTLSNRVFSDPSYPNVKLLMLITGIMILLFGETLTDHDVRHGEKILRMIRSEFEGIRVYSKNYDRISGVKSAARTCVRIHQCFPFPLPDKSKAATRKSRPRLINANINEHTKIDLSARRFINFSRWSFSLVFLRL